MSAEGGRAARLRTDELALFEGNPRRGNVEVIAASLQKTGQSRAVSAGAANAGLAGTTSRRCLSSTCPSATPNTRR